MTRKTIPETGQSADALLSTMEDFRAGDVKWREGRTFGYVFDAGREIEDVAKRAFTMFMSENALDPTQFPSLLRFENDVVQMALSHLNAPEGASGNFTSGGTESILMACKAARDRFRARNPRVDGPPQMILPVTAHAAFHKAAHFLGLEVVPTTVHPETFEADPDAVREAVGPRTALIVGSATSYAHGVVDPIEALGAIAQDNDVLLHVDACIGGFLLPYFRRLGDDIPPFDFSVPGVTSMSMDYHKYAYCPKGASVVLYRDKDLRRHAIFGCARWTGYSVINTTMQSTKSGGPLAAAWAVLGFVGDSGYMEIARGLREATQRVVEGIGRIDGLRVLGDPK
ncbi:MAG: pyridoxal phosphate-dependent decarboxylase family protein, partial [Polyangiales bacterium]